MRILYVNSTRRWGGVKSWCLRSAEALQVRGHRVVIAGRFGDPFLDACRAAGLPTHDLAFGASWSLLTITHFIRILRGERIELVVCNTGRDLSTAGLAAGLLRIPVLHRVGAGQDFRDTLVRRWVHKALVAQMLVPSQLVKDELLSGFSWVRADDVVVSWNSAAGDSHRPPGRVGRRMACLSRLARGKGLDTLLEAVGMMVRAGQTVKLDLIGEGPLEKTLRETVAMMDLEQSVSMHGFVRPATTLLNTAGIGVLPSLSEGFPNTLLEYWSAGLAVVASDLPGVREAIGRFECALLVRPGDASALAESLSLLLNDEEKRQAVARAGLDRWQANFSVADEARRLEEIYSSLIDNAKLR